MSPTPPPQEQPVEVTHARVLAIAGPMTLANLTTPLLGIVGATAVGQLGQAHLLGAVAIGAVVFDFLFWLFGFLRMGTVGLTAQALGAGDRDEQRAVLARALLLSLGFGAAIVALQVPIYTASAAFMGGSAEVTAALATYFFIRVWSAPFTLVNYVVLGWLVGLARTGTALGVQVATNIVNMVATILLVLVWDYGVAGAAWGALIAECFGAALGLTISTRLAGAPLWRTRNVLVAAPFVRMLRVNTDIFIRTAALIAAFSFFTAQSARSGDAVLAANAILHNLALLSSYFLDGFATAAEQLCGRAVGARDRNGFRRAVRLALLWGTALALITSVVIYAAGDPLIALMTTSPEVRVSAAQFLIFAALSPILGVFAYAYDGIYIGATWTRDMRNLMVLALATYFATWWATTSLGNTGLWIAYLVFLGARGAFQAARCPTLERRTFAS